MRNAIIRGCLALLLSLMAGVMISAAPDLQAKETIISGAGSFLFEDAAKRKITVWYYAPALIQPGTRILFVMHGAKRNGREYRDAWLEPARKSKVILLVPEFSQSELPGPEGYILGDVFSSSGALNSRARWSFSTIERIFDQVRADANLAAQSYSIYGHSAGAQFVHRLVLFLPRARIERAVAANAGWYTMPDFHVPWPYGLAGTPITADDLKLSLRQRLTILLGARDTDENAKRLRKTPGALAQGRHRLERGRNFFDQGKKMAEELGAGFGWDIKMVPGAGHSNSAMIPAALAVLY